jgi:hypothetical protein
MARYLLSILIAVFFILPLKAQNRTEIKIPDIPGYLTLKCDFHIHTVFSDGNVWPTIRVKEAWEQGLDAIAITDHIEYRPHSDDVKSDHNRSYEIAKPLAEKSGLILIRGTEITRKMPPGHLNAIFITDANQLERDDWFEACQEAKKQGAFIFWNHPGWKAQQPEKTLWWNEHTRLLEAGLMNGIEAYNDHEYYPEALQWAQEKGLTLLGNSDIHDPIETSYNPIDSHRPLTLVFAAQRNEESIKEAMLKKQTAVYFEDRLVGDQKFLDPIFKASTEILTDKLELENKTSKFIHIRNNSDVDFMLKSKHTPDGYNYQKDVMLKANKITVIPVSGKSEEVKNLSKIRLEYEVTNLTVAPEKCLQIVWEVVN